MARAIDASAKVLKAEDGFVYLDGLRLALAGGMTGDEILLDPEQMRELYDGVAAVMSYADDRERFSLAGRLVFATEGRSYRLSLLSGMSGHDLTFDRPQAKRLLAALKRAAQS